MDPKSLHTASTYINNLLLARGLLRNGVPIEFAEPAKTEGGVDATMAKIMNLVHDMILRRDREADTLSNLSRNIQTLRTTSVQQTSTITHLEARNADLDRQLALSNAQEKSARASLRSAETRNKAIREEMVRLKGTVAQIRGQCANDIRRRDGELKKLKRHLEGRRGREGSCGQVGVVVINPGPARPQQHFGVASDGAVDVASPDYSLKQETTEFLTQLSQGLSDENDALIGLVRNTLTTLRSLQGLPLDPASECGGVHDRGPEDPTNVVISAPPSYEDLASGTDEVLEHLRGLLTNPSFVPLEEVEIREDEIIRLREGWEKMATRWREAVAMIEGWRKRMLDTGDTVNLDDLTRGMNLAAEMPTAGSSHDSATEEKLEEESSNSRELEQPIAPPSIHKENAQMHESSAGILSSSNVLTARSGNARPNLSPRKVSFSSAFGESEVHIDDGNDMSLLEFSIFKTQPSPKKRSSPVPVPMPSMPRTLQDKLDEAEAEANYARSKEEDKSRRKSAAKAVNNRLKGSRRRSTLSPKELEDLLNGPEQTTIPKLEV